MTRAGLTGPESTVQPRDSDVPEWRYFAEALAWYDGHNLTGAQVFGVIEQVRQALRDGRIKPNDLGMAGYRLVPICPSCNGSGDYADHHQACPGGGPRCEPLCPVQMPCQRCHALGVLLGLDDQATPVSVPTSDEEPF